MRILILVLIVISTNLVGCSTKDAILPVPDQSMTDVYNKHMQGVSAGQLMDKRSLVRRPMLEGDVVLSDYVRTEASQLQSRFKTIPNPTLYMFVAPHLASEARVPIPGYITQFRMWETEHFALPGEVSDMDSGFEEK